MFYVPPDQFHYATYFRKRSLCQWLSLTEQEEKVLTVEPTKLDNALARSDQTPMKAVTVSDLDSSLFIAEFEDL